MRRILTASMLVAVIAVTPGVTGCDRPRAPANGLGGFVLAKTTLASVAKQGSAQCFDLDGRTNCLILARQSIAQRTPQIQLEFTDDQPTAVLRRILMDIPGCALDEVRAWFQERLGKPDLSTDEGALWQQTYMVMSLRIASPARCQVIAVAPADEDNVSMLRRAHETPSPGMNE